MLYQLSNLALKTKRYTLEYCKGRSLSSSKNLQRTIYSFEDNRSYAQPRSKSGNLGVEL